MTQASHTPVKSQNLNVHDVIILGAGAAGLMCAGVAGQRGRSVLVLEQARQPAEKIRISGGGRCNFTNLHATPANFLSDNPRFCHSALSGYTQQRFHRAGRALRHRLSREDARAIVLRRLVAPDHRHAAGGMPQGPRAVAARRAHLGDLEEPTAVLSWRPIRASFAAARWWSRPAARRFRKWDRAASATRSPSSSA